MSSPLSATLLLLTTLVMLAVLLRRLRALEGREPGPESERPEVPGGDAAPAIRLLAQAAAGASRDSDRTGHLRADPIRCAEEAREMLVPLSESREVPVHDHYEAVPDVRAHPELLVLALRELLRRAIDACRPGRGDVTLAVGMLPGEGGADEVVIALADDGPEPPPAGGLPRDAIEALVDGIGARLVIDRDPWAGNRATLYLPAVAPARGNAHPGSTKAGVLPRTPAMERLMGIGPT